MMTAVLLLGASGYIGGQVLKQLADSHPHLQVTALIRDPDVAKRISDSYPDLRTIIGDLNDNKLIEEEAAKVSIVINAASNKHMGAAMAIHNGLKTVGSTSYWIQISGASLLAAAELASPSFRVGLASDSVFDDLDGIDAIRSIIRAHPARQMDNYILDVQKTTSSVKTALILAPMIYGKGEGPIKQSSIQLPSLARVTLERGHVVRAGPGKNYWGNVHVADVGRLFAQLAEQAGHGAQDNLWGESGIYLTSVHEMSFAELSERVGQAALAGGMISSSEVEELSNEGSDEALPGGSVLFGTNARGKARRAEAVLGWTPVEHSLEVEIPRAVAEEFSKKQ